MSELRQAERAEAGAITVSVTFFADLRRFLPRGADGPQRYTLARPALVSDLLGVIGIAPDADITIAVDGELADRETPLADGAEVMLLSPMEGGAGTEQETPPGASRSGSTTPTAWWRWWR
jgi:hypothetical protein